MKIKLDGQEYELDTEKALEDGYLKPVSYPLSLGDVYIHPKRETNPFLLISALYKGDRRFQLSWTGVSTNSENFYHSLHTKQEIETYLRERGMIYSHNVFDAIYKIIQEKN